MKFLTEGKQPALSMFYLAIIQNHSKCEVDNRQKSIKERVDFIRFYETLHGKTIKYNIQHYSAAIEMNVNSKPSSC